MRRMPLVLLEGQRAWKAFWSVRCISRKCVYEGLRSRSAGCKGHPLSSGCLLSSAGDRVQSVLDSEDGTKAISLRPAMQRPPLPCLDDGCVVFPFTRPMREISPPTCFGSHRTLLPLLLLLLLWRRK